MQRTIKIIILISIGFFSPLKALALPSPEDIPEEVLRAEIITSARSPLDNQPLTAAEYALLEEQLATSIYPPKLIPRFDN